LIYDEKAKPIWVAMNPPESNPDTDQSLLLVTAKAEKARIAMVKIFIFILIK